MLRRTKIVATLGPATDRPGVMRELFKAGVDVVRLNFSHGTADDHKQRAKQVREQSAETGRYVGILVDLQGPKIRIAKFRDGKINLKDGATFVLDVDFPADEGDETQVGCCYETLAQEIHVGNTLMLDDGRVVMDVEAIDGNRVTCKVVVGGDLSNHKGINLKGGGLSAPALTDKDRADIITAAEIDADFLAVSFPCTASDINAARDLMEAAGGNAGIVSKIERAEALNVIEEIIEASDVIMVARGDLGVEIGDAALPVVQKDLINKSRSMNKPVITATQMMESMITSSLPTRAEVFDVANAVYDGTDAIMLSAETAAGQFPVKAVEAMDRVCLEIERQPRVRKSGHRMHCRFERIDEATAMSAMYMANHSNITAIVALTESGATPLWMSRISSGIPIYAMTAHEKTIQRSTVLRGVYPIKFITETSDHVQVNKEIISKLEQLGFARDGDRIILTKGDLMGVAGGTNALKILCVGEGLLA